MFCNVVVATRSYCSLSGLLPLTNNDLSLRGVKVAPPSDRYFVNSTVCQRSPRRRCHVCCQSFCISSTTTLGDSNSARTSASVASSSSIALAAVAEGTSITGPGAKAF